MDIDMAVWKGINQLTSNSGLPCEIKERDWFLGTMAFISGIPSLIPYKIKDRGLVAGSTIFIR